MKIKIFNGLILVNILCLLLLIIIYLVPQSVIRIILGLPFLLYFPGYALTSALFLDNKKIDVIERFALSCGMSFAIVGLIGFGLNYTHWGIKLEPVLFAVTIFVILVSSIALIRKALSTQGVKYFNEFVIKLPDWQGNRLSKGIFLILVVCIVGALGVLGYTIAYPKIGEKFTELYMLGLNGKAQDYPTSFYLRNGQVDSVEYGEAVLDTVNKWGRITLGIVNHEGENTEYYISANINGEEQPLQYQDQSVNRIGPVSLNDNEKWEGEIGIIPHDAGDNQKFEILLFKGNNNVQTDSLQLWINVTELE